MKLFVTYVIVFLLFLATGCKKSYVAEHPEDVCPLETGEKIPDVTLKTAFDRDINLQNLINEKNTLLIFYRGGWCPFCNTHLSQLAEIDEKLYDMGVQIIAISPDKPSYLKESTMEHELNYQLLSDSDMNVTKQFRVAFKVDSATVNRYKNNGMDLAERSGHDHYLLPVPAAFLVDTTGTIRYRYFNPDYKVRIKNEDILAAVDEMMD